MNKSLRAQRIGVKPIATLFVLLSLASCTSIHLAGNDVDMCLGINDDSSYDVADFTGQLTNDEFAYFSQPSELSKLYHEVDRGKNSSALIQQGLKLMQSRVVGEESRDPVERMLGNISWAADYEGVAELHSSVLEAAEDAHSQMQWFRESFEVPDVMSQRDGQNSFSLAPLTSSSLKQMAKIQETYSKGGYDALVFQNAAKLSNLLKQNKNGDFSFDEMKGAVLLSEELDRGKVFSNYLRAYFRNGKFFQVELASADIASKIVTNIVSDLPDGTLDAAATEDVKKAVEKNLNALCPNATDSKCLITKGLGDGAFVARHGGKLQYSGISVALGQSGNFSANATYPKSLEVGPQLVRVIAEAMFDSSKPSVPSVAGSTACKHELFQCLDDKSDSILKKKIAYLNEKSGESEALAISISSMLIRGGSFFSLDNEAVAESLATMAGVISRKMSEKIIWKKYLHGGCAVNEPKVSILPLR